MRTLLTIAAFFTFTACQKDSAGEATTSSTSCTVATSQLLTKTLNPRSMTDRLVDSLKASSGLTIQAASGSSEYWLNPGTEVIVGKTEKCGGDFEVFTVQQEIRARDFVAPFEADSCVAYMEHNAYLRPTALSPKATFNDTNYASQAHLGTINLPAAYDKFYGSSGVGSQEVVIAIMDTGIQGDHPDMSGKYWNNSDEVAGNGVDDDNNGQIDDVRGYNFRTNNGDPEPMDWASPADGEFHGTHVAGLAGAVENNSAGVVGAGGANVRFMDLNIFGSSNQAEITSAAAAIDYAIANGANVLNISLAAPGESETLRTKVAAAVTAGIVVVIAAGNETKEISATQPYMPAIYGAANSGAITVGAVYSTNSLQTSYSNFSTTFVELYAPGSDATNTGLLSTVPGSTYGRLEGTSMATPIVSAAAALAIAQNKNAGGSPTPAQVETWLTGSANCVSSLKILDLDKLYTSVTE